MCIAILRGQFGRTPTALGLLQNELIISILFKTIFINYLVDVSRVLLLRQVWIVN
jgi:hypothetical protein